MLVASILKYVIIILLYEACPLHAYTC
jgi:hypothetical protein